MSDAVREPRVVLKGFSLEIDVPANRDDWEPDDYATYSTAILALAASLAERFGKVGTTIHSLFAVHRANELRGECCARFGLFPPELDSVRVRYIESPSDASVREAHAEA
jgi:hypothetical protein